MRSSRSRTPTAFASTFTVAPKMEPTLFVLALIVVGCLILME
jgi:hypothetical protein